MTCTWLWVSAPLSALFWQTEDIKTWRKYELETHRGRKRREGWKRGTGWLSLQKRGSLRSEKKGREGRKGEKIKRLHVVLWGSCWVMERDRIAGKLQHFQTYFAPFFLCAAAEEAPPLRSHPACVCFYLGAPIRKLQLRSTRLLWFVVIRTTKYFEYSLLLLWKLQ